MLVYPIVDSGLTNLTSANKQNKYNCYILKLQKDQLVVLLQNIFTLMLHYHFQMQTRNT